MQNKSILIVTIPEKGHINPLIGIAQHLQDSGYNLAFFSQRNISDQLQKAGLHVPVYTDNSATNSDEQFITRGKAFVEQLNDKIWLRNWIKTLLIDAVPHQIELIHRAIEDFQADLIVADPMIYGAAIVAHQRKIPWAGVSSSLNPITPPTWTCELTETLAQLEPERSQLFKARGLKPQFRVSDAISPWLNIVFSTEDYMPRSHCGNDFSFYTGDCLPPRSRGDEIDFPFERLKTGSKKVYMSLGSQIYYHPQLFLAVAKALLDPDIQLIFSINELLNTDFVNELPENVIAVSYTPQLQLLQQMDLFITHGGANSVMESLAHGVPVALLPICNDQYLQEKFVCRASVGISLDPKNPDPETYRRQLLPLLEPKGAFKSQAKKIQASFQNRGGSKEAASLIEQLCMTRQPMLPSI